jgi:hypothetical protein
MTPNGAKAVELTKLEAAVLCEMAAIHADEQEAIEWQMANCQVIKRVNTGAGFYTHLQNDNQKHKIRSHVISRVFAEVDGLINPLIFVLFMEDGEMKLLEGAAVVDDTTSTNFEKVNFSIVSSF